MSLPPESEKVSVTVDFVPVASGEIWTRRFGEESFRSSLSAKGGRLEERFGPIKFVFDLVPTDSGIEWKFCSMSVLGLRCPHVLSPRIQAAETEVESRYRFTVAARFPLIGTVVGYEGVLELDDVIRAAARA